MIHHRLATVAVAAVYRGRGCSVECSDPWGSGMPKPLLFWSCICAGGKRKGIVWGSSSSRVRLWRNLEKVNNSKYGYSTPSTKWRTTELLEVYRK